MTVIMLGMGIYEDIKEMIDVCIPKEQILAINFEGFLGCANSVGGVTGDVFNIIKKIKNKDYLGALALIPKVLESGGNVVKQCGNFLK